MSRLLEAMSTPAAPAVAKKPTMLAIANKNRLNELGSAFAAASTPSAAGATAVNISGLKSPMPPIVLPNKTSRITSGISGKNVATFAT